MTPKKMATDNVLKNRRKAFLTGQGLTHWPHEYHTANFQLKTDFVPVEETPVITKLIGLAEE